MSLSAMLNTPILVHRLQVDENGNRTGTDADGNPADAWDDPVGAVGYLDAAALSQNAGDDGLAETSAATALLIVDGTTVAVAEGDLVEAAGELWVVDGRPSAKWSPRLGRAHHVEARLTRAQ